MTDEMRTLVDTLNAASKAYYQESMEIMSDREYDILYEKLVRLEEETGIRLSNSPTLKVGFEAVDNLKKVEHEVPLLSLDKTKQVTDLEDFLGSHEGILSWKLDGLTVVLKYKNGKLVQAITRGNGQIGEDITHNAVFFKNIPLKISYGGDLTVRGEAVISYPDFEKLNEELELSGTEKYKNPRNLCSGTVRQLNSEVSAKRNVNYFVFGIVKTDYPLPDNKSDVLSWLASLGFQCVETVKVTSSTVADEVGKFEERITHNIFASDGLVLTLNSINYSESLGRTSKFPKDSIAFKWTDEIKETTLIKIDWNTSRTGLINPVAVFSPVELEGTTVNRASLHNISIIEGLQLGIGDTIKVYKANMIIPQVADNITRSNTIIPPNECPVCKEASVLKEMNGIKFLYCENTSCKAKLKSALTHFVSRDAMNIDGFSENTILKFMEKGFLNDYTDIFKLNRYKNEIISMEGFGVKSYENLAVSIEKAKNAKLYNFIYALGVTHVGLSNAKLLCRHYSNNLNDIINASPEELSTIEGFGGVISESVYNYFHNKINLQLLNEALSFITFEEEAYPEGGGMAGLTFVITGEVERFENRNALKKYIEANGGKAASSVTSKTAYLINNNINSGSAKNKKAKELGVPIITEDEFIEQFGKKG